MSSELSSAHETSCPDFPRLLSVRRIHELYADMLFAKHSYDDAIIHYIKVSTRTTMDPAASRPAPSSCPCLLPKVVTHSHGFFSHGCSCALQAESPVAVVCARFNLFPDDLPLPRIVMDMIARNSQPMNRTGLTGTERGVGPAPLAPPWLQPWLDRVLT